MKFIALILSIISASIFIAGIAGVRPSFYNSGGLILVFVLSIISIIYSFKYISEFVILSRVISAIVILGLIMVVLKTLYLQNKLDSITREEINEDRLRVEKARLKHTQKQNTTGEIPNN